MKEDTKTLMVSSCLLGIPCRYDGQSKAIPELIKLLDKYHLVPFCPESLGGLSIPRLPAEIQNGDGSTVLSGISRVINKENQDYTREFVKGAQATLEMAKQIKPEFIVLKANSPSCGVGRIYSGGFNGILKQGDGVTAALLRNAGEKVISESDLFLLEFFGKKKLS